MESTSIEPAPESELEESQQEDIILENTPHIPKKKKSSTANDRMELLQKIANRQDDKDEIDLFVMSIVKVLK